MDWVSEHGGGLILVAGDIYTPQLAATTDDALKDLQKLYPVVLSASISELSLDAKSEQPWPVALTPEGENAGFLQLADNSPDIKAQWHEFPGVYRCYPTAGFKKAATVYAKFGDPRVQNEQGQPILFAAQFYGSGRILYIGSPEMWRLAQSTKRFSSDSGPRRSAKSGREDSSAARPAACCSWSAASTPWGRWSAFGPICWIRS